MDGLSKPSYGECAMSFVNVITRRQSNFFGLANLWLLAALSLLLPGCASDNNYFPLEPGYWWYYNITATILDDNKVSRFIVSNSHRAGEETDKLVQRAQQDALMLLKANGAGAELVAHKTRNDRGVIAHNPALIMFPHSLDSNEPWAQHSTLQLIESRTFARADRVVVKRYPVTLKQHIAAHDETVRVPAGKFTRCVRIDGMGEAVIKTDRGNAKATVSVKTSQWFAPGVGLIKKTREETSESPFLKPGQREWTLAAYGR